MAKEHLYLFHLVLVCNECILILPKPKKGKCSFKNIHICADIDPQILNLRKLFLNWPSHQDAKFKVWVCKYNKPNLSIKPQTGALPSPRMYTYICCAGPTTQAHSHNEQENSPFQWNQKVFNKFTVREREGESGSHNSCFPLSPHIFIPSGQHVALLYVLAPKWKGTALS